MNTATVLDKKALAEHEGSEALKIKVPVRNMLIVAALMALIYIPYKVYQHKMAFAFGLDSFEDVFDTYWMNVLYFQLVALMALGVALVGWIWATRDRDLDNLAPEVELQRYMNLMAWLVMYLVTIYAIGVLFTEADASWHQVTVRDTDFTPTHIPLFYFCVPAFIVAGVSSFVWARTRLPEFANRISIPFVLIVAGPFMIMPNVGFNEWGHTFFYAEELFAAPIHWGFVVLGWSAMAAGGLVLQIIRRVSELTTLVKLDD